MQKSAKATKKEAFFARASVFFGKRERRGTNVERDFLREEMPRLQRSKRAEKKSGNRGRVSKDLRRCRKSEVCPCRATANTPPEHVALQHAVSGYAGLCSPYRPQASKKEQTRKMCVCSFFGAGGRGRTDTVSLPLDFESSTSANSITPARNRGIIP